MPINFNLRGGYNGGGCDSSCPTLDGCPSDRCPDLTIRRHDTKPAFKVAIEDCDGPMDFRGLAIEVNMWALAKLKAALAADATYFRLADDIGFEQVMVGDVIVMDRARLPEHMLVTGFDETEKLVQVERGYHASTPSAWPKGTVMRIFRILNAPAEAEVVLEDRTDVDGTVEKDAIAAAYLIYEWASPDTCLPGCYWLEFKVIKMIDLVLFLPGGNWTGDTYQDGQGYFYTGLTVSDSTVRLSFDQVADLFLLPEARWEGEYHLHSDLNYYTGTTHDEGSVLLNKTGVPSDDATSYNSSGLVALASFTDPDLTPADFGCRLGEGVEWVRRFPVTGEGFLIKVAYSPTTEL